MSKEFMLCEKADLELLSYYEKLGFIASQKYDGTRALMILQNGKIILKGRSGYTYENKFPEIIKALKELNLKEGTILDGELICDDFQKIQSRTLTKEGYKTKELSEKYPAKYLIFDILANGYNDISNFSLIERLDILRGYFTIADTKKMQPYLPKCLFLVENTPKIKELWEKAKIENWEGIIIKNPKSVYQNRRSNNWLKLKCVKRRIIEFSEYTLNNAGVRAISKNGIVIQIAGKHSKKFLELYNKNGFVNVEVEYLEEFKSGMLRQPICKEVKESENS